MSSASLGGRFPDEKTCCLSSKTWEKNVCRGRMIGLSTEMARGNFVCAFHWHQFRTINNIFSCPLPTHSATLSSTPIPERLYRVFDEEGRKKCHPIVQGTKWYTSCRRNADKIVSYKDENVRPKKGKRAVLLQMQILQLFYSIERNKISQLKLSIYYIDRYFAFNKISLTAK